MVIPESLLKVLRELPDSFFGNLEITVQAGHPNILRITQSHQLTKPYGNSPKETHVQSERNR